MISGLCAAEGGALADQHIAFLAAVLLFAGHETTVVRIDLGTLLLLTNPLSARPCWAIPLCSQPQWRKSLEPRPQAAADCRAIRETDIEIGGVTMRAGDAVLLDLGAANHDHRTFDDPDRFDVTRQPNPHLAFGHGPRFCIGAPLARIELQAVFERLVPRFPTLAMANPIEQLRTRDDLLTGGLAELLVTW